MRVIFSVVLLITSACSAMAHAAGPAGADATLVADTPGAKAALAEMDRLIAEHIPAHYRKPPVPLADDHNAWTWWKPAADQFAAISIADYHAFLNQLEEDPAGLSDGQIRQCEQLIAGLKPAFDLIERGIAAGDCRVPMTFDFANIGKLAKLRTVVHLYLFQARRAIDAGRFDHAAACIQHVMDIGELLCGRDNVLVVDLIGMAIRLQAVRTIHALAAKQTDPAFLAALLKIVPEQQHVGRRTRHTVTAELAMFTIPWMRQFAVKTAADQPAAVRIKAAEQCFALDLMELNEEQKQAVLQFLFDHSHVLSPASILDSQVPPALATIEQAEKPWDPAFLPPSQDSIYSPGMKELVDCVKAGRPLDATQLHDALQQIENEPGFSSNKRSLLLDYANIAYQHMTRVNIAVRLYTLKTGRPPVSLGELVAAKIIDRVPADPFDGQPLRYDARRQLVWSVGKNGVDDHGEGEPGKMMFDTADLVMSTAPSAK